MEKQSIKAEIICDSIERVGNNRITTWKLTYWRAIHAEFLTHAMLKSNSASSRAIPFNKMIEMVKNDPFIPIKFMKDHKGMQGNDFIENVVSRAIRVQQWLDARDAAVEHAITLHTPLSELYEKHPDYEDFMWEDEEPVTKQICNRILEPYMWHTIICTATEFENFFALRAHGAAEIHLQDLAYKMLEAYNANTPKELKEGDWHIPFEEEIERHSEAFNSAAGIKEWTPVSIFDSENMRLKDLPIVTDAKVKISTAKCAQVSYLKFGSDDYEDLIDLHDSLVIRPYEGKRGIRTIEDPIHASPASHCAQAMFKYEFDKYERLQLQGGIDTKEKGICHNLKGFKSYRSMLPNENSTDIRVIKK